MFKIQNLYWCSVGWPYVPFKMRLSRFLSSRFVCFYMFRGVGAIFQFFQQYIFIEYQYSDNMVKIFTSIYQFMIWTFHYVVGGNSSQPTVHKSIHTLEYRPLKMPRGNLSTKTNPLKFGRQCVKIIVKCRYSMYKLSVIIIIHLQSRLPQEFIFVTVNFNIRCTELVSLSYDIFIVAQKYYIHTHTYTCTIKRIFKRVRSGLYNEAIRVRSACNPGLSCDNTLRGLSIKIW